MNTSEIKSGFLGRLTLTSTTSSKDRLLAHTLNSIDLNPVLATLGRGAVTGAASTLTPRSYDLVKNILYPINDYSGNTHTNRILTQTGSIVDQALDNDGNIHAQQVVASYLTDMTFNGFNHRVVKDGQPATELEYVYAPFAGLSIVSAIYINGTNAVIGTQVLSESSAGGSSTVGDL